MEWGPETTLVLSDEANAGLNTGNIPQIPDMYFDSAVKPENNIFEDTDGVLKRLPSSGLFRGGFAPSAYTIYDVTVDDIVPIGRLETLAIIKMRNTVLRDSGINLPVPIADSASTETDSLKALITAANKTPGNAYNFYYPAASYAYAYEPAIKQGEILSDKFKAHKWFLPTPGDAQMFRFLRTDTDKLKNPVAIGVINPSSMITTGENGSYCYKIEASGYPVNGAYNGSKKWTPNACVVPMVQF